ncbi:MAG: hypothetical protein HQ567_10320 [Candidatus Nealsonbacteria bacterium]|nr:hypothetical protein [Candidatus Nealsonbacteria bacterium]
MWKKRATVVTGATHRRRTWQSRCGWYRVVHSRCLFGPRKGRQAIADVFYATKLVVVSGSTCWEVISQHRKRGPAVRSCEQDARKNRDTTQVCDRCGERPPTHFEVQTLFESNAQLCGPCWHQLRRHRRCHRVSAGGSRSGTRRRIASSPGQLSFSFSHEVRD